jgi:hypothetical protein
MKRRGKSRRVLRRRYGRQIAGTLSALRTMETARGAYRRARASGLSARAAHTSAMNSVRHQVGAGAWDIANSVRREAGE